jgi:MEDS: MEthanogen/methylotroph, DcmR Sensory domain
MIPVSSASPTAAVFSEPFGHLLRFDGPGDAPSSTLLAFIARGVNRGEGVLTITTPRREDGLRRGLSELGADAASAEKEGRLVWLDSEESLAAIAPDRPEWRRFDELVGTCLRKIDRAFGCAGLRVYGDMVGLLWKAGRFQDLVRLEEFWNRLRDEIGFSLYCGYPIDVFGPEFRMSSVDSILCAHTHVIPSYLDGRIERAVNQAMDEVLGDRANGLRALIKANFRPSWAPVPPGQAMILWLRNNLDSHADAILARAREYSRQ